MTSFDDMAMAGVIVAMVVLVSVAVGWQWLGMTWLVGCEVDRVNVVACHKLLRIDSKTLTHRL